MKRIILLTICFAVFLASNIYAERVYITQQGSSLFYLETDSIKFTTSAKNIVEATIYMRNPNNPEGDISMEEVILINLTQPIHSIKNIYILNLTNGHELKTGDMKLVWKDIDRPDRPEGILIYNIIKEYAENNYDEIAEKSKEKYSYSIKPGDKSALEAITEHLNANVKKKENVTINLDFNGKWTNGMAIKVIGNNAEITHNGNKLKGTLTANTITGVWSGFKFCTSISTKGEFKIIMMPDGHIDVYYKDGILNDWVKDYSANRS